MRVVVRGCSLRAPGLPDWDAAKAVLTGRAAYLRSAVSEPSPRGLPTNEQRRLPATARYALDVGMDALAAAGISAECVATVFASCGSDGLITHQICESLARPEPEMSPTRFHNSVHNAPAGYWSIALRTHAPSTSICGGDASFAAGLVEAAAQCEVEARPILLVAYDLPYPVPMAQLWDAADPSALALLVAPAGAAAGRVLRIELTEGEQPSAWPEPLPRTLRRNPVWAAAPLLALLAQEKPSRVVIPAHGHCQLALALADS